MAEYKYSRSDSSPALRGTRGVTFPRRCEPEEGVWTRISNRLPVFRDIFIVAVLALLCGCSKPKKPAAFDRWEQVRQLTDEFMLQGNGLAFFESVDPAGASSEKVEAAKRFATVGWKNASLRKHHKETREMTPQEYAVLINETRKRWPEEMRSAADRWAVQPERIIMYHFEHNEDSVRWYFGAYHRDGKWYLTRQD